MSAAAVLASSSPLTNDVPSDQNVPDPTSAGIWSEASNAAGLAVWSSLMKVCSSGAHLRHVGVLVRGEEPGEATADALALRRLPVVGELGRPEVLHHLPHLGSVAERPGADAADQDGVTAGRPGSRTC